jgi:predicted restriction endonuclease
MSKELTIEQKARKAARRKQYEQDHKTELAARRKQYHQDHKAKRNAGSRKYHHDHKVEINARHKRHCDERKDEVAVKNALYRLGHKDEIAAYQKQYRQDHKAELAARNREDKLIRKFGIDLEQYNQMLTAQDGRCAICGSHQNEYKKAFAVDHDHNTGKIRGLLCHKCNSLLGHAKDDIEILRSATRYLQINLAD